MKLTCYVNDGWTMHIRPARPARAWMDQTPDRYSYRCLPMAIANTHGWEIFTPGGFWCMWTGGQLASDVHIRTDADLPPGFAPVSIFGSGIFTLHTHGIFRTPPNWNLMVTGPLNDPKDGASALSGIIESDWVVMTHTMNWALTRPGHWVHFAAGETISHLMPVERGMLEQWQPEQVPMKDDPDLHRQFTTWSASRDTFQSRQTHGWQKDYFRGVDMNQKEAEGHQTKLRLCPFSSIKR